VGKDLNAVLEQAEVQKQLALRGGYVSPMSPAEVVAFVRGQQQTWNPLLQKLAAQPTK
jgi:tripartite-type tricarboxylate transporter receptor subunit TctC